MIILGVEWEREAPMKSYDIYSRILYLATNHKEHCDLRAKQSNQPKTMQDIVKEVIAQDNTLVWC